MLNPPRHSASGLRARAAAVIAAIATAAALALVPTAAHAANTGTADVYAIEAGTVFTTPVGQGVLANDLGLGATALAQRTTSPNFGTVGVFNADGTFTYTPAPGFVGSDGFTYCIALPVVGCVSANISVTITVTSTIERIGGADRYATSALVSSKKFLPGVDVAYVASGETFPDALSASAAAGAKGGPVLLVAKNAVPTDVAAELTRLKPKSIVLLGGTNAVSADVETALHSYAPAVTRIGGADRYAVSAGVSAATFPVVSLPGVPIAYVASGEVFPDALSGSPAAGLKGGPVLLVGKDAVPAAIAAELRRLAPTKIVVLGGVNAVSPAVETALNAIAPTTRIAGDDRFATSTAVSRDAFPSTVTTTVYVASGETFPDALSGAAAAIKNHAPVLLVTKDTLPAVTAVELDRLHPTRIVVLGGTNAISDATYADLKTHLAKVRSDG